MASLRFFSIKLTTLHLASFGNGFNVIDKPNIPPQIAFEFSGKWIKGD